MSASITTDSGWLRVGDVSPESLTDARLQLHHAAQIAVSAAISYIPARPDDSQTALSWSPTLRALVTEPIAAERVLRIGLRLEDLTLHAIDAATRSTHSLALAGRTVADAHAWLAKVVADAGLDSARLTARKHYTIPAHPVAGGAPFSVGAGGELAELERYWSNAARLLDELQRDTPDASDVRCWPHHFDIATLITPLGAPESARRTIGVGHSSGDEWYAEPYWYVGSNPYPATTDLPPLAGHARWHTKSWVGAVLVASDYASASASEQFRQVTAYAESAVASCRRLLANS